MKAIVYSNRNQECERACNLLKVCHFDEVIVYHLDQDFTINQFIAEFGSGAEFPQISLGCLHVGGLKDTLKYMSDRGMFA